MIRAALLAAAVVLAASSDWALSVNGERVCAKSEGVCREAEAAIKAGRWPIVPRDARIKCAPSPNCFSPESETIQGRKP